MKITKHYLPARPTLREWLDSTVPEAGMLIWLDDDKRPVLIGDLNKFGFPYEGTKTGWIQRVVAYARIDIAELARLADSDGAP